MKAKNVYRIIAALGALLVMSGCEMWAAKTADETGEAVQQFTKDGRPLINLNIGYNNGGTTGKSPALFEDLAKSFDFMEVIFKDSGSNYYAKSVRRPNALKIAIPADTYNGLLGDAVMLVGYYNGGNPILLATGKIVDPVGGAITATTSGITFTLYPLAFDISNTSSSPVSFTTPFATDAVDFREITGGESSRGTKYFSVLDAGGTTIEMELTISSSTSATMANLVPVSLTTDLAIQPYNLPDLGILGLNPFQTATISGDFNNDEIILTIEAELISAGSSGLVAISFDVPVKGFEEDSTDNPDAVTWHLRTGLSNADLDKGVRSLGGAILLELGTVISTEYNIIAGW